MQFLNSLKTQLKFHNSPFNHWELDKPLNEGMLQEMCNVEIVDLNKVNINYDGTRALDGGEGKFRKGIESGGKALKFRCFINKENSKHFKNLSNLIDELRNKDTYQFISELVKKDLSKSYVRLEVICDRQGFWLKPHCDIKEKLVSCLVFANPYGESENLGTDFYNEKLEKVKTIPYKHNYGYFFTSGPNAWHGMEKKEIKKERRCLQVNYVTFQTDWPVD